MKITKNWLQKRNVCLSSYNHICDNDYIGLDSSSFLKKLIDNDRLSDAYWLIIKVMNKKQSVQYAIFAAEQVINIFEKEYAEDKGPRNAIEAAKNYSDTKTITAAYTAANAAKTAYTAANAATDAYAATYAYAAAYAANAAVYAAKAAVTYVDDVATYINAVVAFAANAHAHATTYTAHTPAYAAKKEMRLKILMNGLKILNH